MNLKIPKLRFLFLLFWCMAFSPEQNNPCQNFNDDAFLSENKTTKNFGIEIHELYCLGTHTNNYQNQLVYSKTLKETEPARVRQLSEYLYLYNKTGN